MVVVELAMIHGLVMTTCYMATVYDDYDLFRGFVLQIARIPHENLEEVP